ncbi:MAG: hypothetical protein ACT4OP_13160 [Actinomycetota bacterium]
MTHDQIDRMVRQANPVPDPTLLETVDVSVLVFDEQRRTEMQSDQPIKTAQGEEKPRRGPLVGIAAAVALVIGALILLQSRDDAPVADQKTASPVEIATAFVKAYQAYDVDSAASYLAPDANLAGFGEDWPLNRKFLDFIGYELIIGSCETVATGDFTTRVRCTYDFHALISKEMGLGPFSGSYFDLSIRDGAIVSVGQRFESMSNGFSSQMWEPFAAWVAETYPEDAAIMYADWPNQSLQALTDESLSLWGQRSWDYAMRVTPEEIVDPEELSFPAPLTRTKRGSVYDVTFTFTVPGSGWESNFPDVLIAKSVHGAQGAEAILFWTSFPEGPHANPCGAISNSPPSTASLATAVANLPGIELLSGPSDVTVGGLPAKKVTFIVREDVGCDPGFFYTWRAPDGGAIWDVSEKSDAIKVWFVDVDGTLLVIASETKADAGPDVLAEIEYIVQSIRFD